MASSRRYAVRLVGIAVLLFFTVFFFVPIVWLFLAPTKTDGQLLTQSPFAFGSFSTFGTTFHRIVTYSGHSLLIWLKNSAIYSFGGTLLAVAAAIPAGYGLALTQFVGRRALLTITLVVMIMPATALVLPLFLEINKLGLYGTICRSSCRSASSPSGCISPTSTSRRRSRRTCSPLPASTGPPSGACSVSSRYRSRGRSSGSSRSSRSWRPGTTSSFPS
jgi:ABC-type Fe3+ transport system permease subunit